MSDIAWHPIEELQDKYANNLLLLAPELVDGDCNEAGAGMGYWQDDGLLWNASQKECDERDPDRNYGCFMACRWSMTNDEWSHVPCTPTHYAVIGGAS